MGKNKKMEETLSDADDNAIYRDLFLQIPDLVYILDKHCSLINCNLNFIHFLGMNALEERSPGSLYKIMVQSGRWSEKQIKEIKTKDIEVILSGNTIIDGPGLPTIDEQDNIRHFVISRIPVFDKNQSVIALMVIFKDISEKLIMQDQLDKLKAQLQHYNATQTLTTNTITFQKELDHPLNILVVEDNIIAQKAAQGILMQIDCSVDVANSETQLFSFFKPGKYDMVFMDIGLEETSGYMLAKKIRTEEKGTNYHVPIIALTGYKADMLTSDCGYYQMEGAITKPLTIEQAQQLIQRYIFKIDIPVTGLKLATSPV